MNKTVELVCAWAAYEEAHPQSNLDDFFRYSLLQAREKESREKSMGGIVPQSPASSLLKLIGRIFQMFEVYVDIAVKDAGLNQKEEFMLLSNINFGEPRKTELIYASILELSTGTNILNRLREEGYILEYNDEEDKRSKRIKLTSRGEKVLVACRRKLTQIAELIFTDMGNDEKKLCIQLLTGVEIKFNPLWQQHKNKSFKEVCEDLS